MKIAVVGRGFAGLTAAIKLREARHEIVLIGPESDFDSASTAAHGASTIKGLHEASQKLFALKLLGHREFPLWKKKIELLSKRPIPAIQGVWERFANHQEFLTEQDRIYKRRFLGAFPVSHDGGPLTGILSLDDKMHYWFRNFYPQDFWIQTDEYLLALAESCLALGIPVLTEKRVTRVLEEENQATVFLGDESFVFDAVVVAAGTSVKACLAHGISTKNISLFGAPGYTAMKSFKEKKQEEFCVVKELSAVAQHSGKMYLGSTTEVNGIPLAEEIDKVGTAFISNNANEMADEFAKLSRRVLGADSIGEHSLELRWGVRVRSRDRIPMVGPITAKRRVFINTGYYKSGIALTPLGAALLVDLVDKKMPPPELQAMDVCRFKTSN